LVRWLKKDFGELVRQKELVLSATPVTVETVIKKSEAQI
jgi:hypothetical protein